MTQRKVIYLITDEIARVRGLELSESQAYLDPIRDIFLFCCFSGLRHPDVNNLRRSDIKGNVRTDKIQLYSPFRYSPGVIPVIFLKILLKW